MTTPMGDDALRSVNADGERSVAAERIEGNVATGDNAQIDARTVVLAPGVIPAPSDVRVPTAGLSNLPRPPSGIFVGREAPLLALAGVFDADRIPTAGARAAVGQAVAGGGGVGKSELALQYAARRRGAGAVVWWVAAETQDQMNAALAALAIRLHPAMQFVWSTAEAAQWAMGWLEAHAGWLVVLDNVEDPALIDPLLGSLYTGDILITTRRDVSWARRGLTSLRLEVLTRAASVALLRGTLPDLAIFDHFDQAADELAERLGDLPLALEQAAGYVEQQKITLDAYLDRLRTDAATLLATVASGDDAARAVTRTWHLTLSVLAAREPSTVEILAALAWLGPDTLPRSAVTMQGAPLGEADRLLGVLASYSLIALTSETITIHRLLQVVLRATFTSSLTVADSSSGDGMEQDADTRAFAPGQQLALTWLQGAIPGGDPDRNVSGWVIWRALLPHIDALVGHLAPLFPDAGYARLLGETGYYLWVQGRPADARPLHERAVAITEAVLGPEHPTMAHRLNSLAATLGTLGHHAEALPLRQRALRITEAALGDSHPDTAQRSNNLARTLGALGRHAEALVLQQRAVAITQTRLGPEHPNTGQFLDNLGYTLGALGRHTEALPLRRRALDITEGFFGSAHPDTGLRLDNLADTLSALGRHAEALSLRQRAMAITEAAVGPEHPDMGRRLNHLAANLIALGQHEAALPLQRRALAIAETVLGPNHPDTGRRLSSLANTLDALGRHTDALTIHERAVTINATVLGSDHPTTIAGREHWSACQEMVMRGYGSSPA